MILHLIVVHVPSQDLDFQHHMSWSFLCSMSGGKEVIVHFVDNLTCVELLTLTVKTFFLCPHDEESGGHINLPLSIRLSVRPSVHPSVLPSVRPSGYRYMVCQAISSYSFGATALIFCRMFIHIMEMCMSTWFWFPSSILKMTGTIVGLSFFSYWLHKGNMVCLANSSYSFRATALICCRMFIHIMEVCMSTAFWFWSNILKMTGSWT